MLGQQFYHETVRNVIVAFGTMFNNIQIVRKNNTGNIIQSMKVPLAYGPKQKYLTRLDADPSLANSTAITLPRLGFEIGALSYDATRKLNRVQKFKKVKTDSSDANKLDTQFNYAGDFQSRRAIIYTLTFTTKFYLYGPVTSSKVIKTVQVDQFANLPEVSPTREQRYSVTPNPVSADADDDFGFNETSSFFEDAKTFDPTSGSDVNKTNE